MAKSKLEIIAKHKFLYLLLSLLLLLLIHPLLLKFVATRIIVHFFFSVVLLSAIYTVSQKGALRIVAIILLLGALTGTWIGYVTGDPTLDIANLGFTILFLSFTGILIASDVFREKRVTFDTISGAICIYLLIGLTWAELYSLIEFLEPGSFSIQKYLPATSGYHPEHQTPLLLYYSFVTLTTLGYGDIVPLSAPAKALSYLEAIVGQIFVVVLIARLVGLHIAHSSMKDSA